MDLVPLGFERSWPREREGSYGQFGNACGFCFQRSRSPDNKQGCTRQQVGRSASAIGHANRRQAAFHIGTWVVLPDHTNAIWTLPDRDANQSGREGERLTQWRKALRFSALRAEQPGSMIPARIRRLGEQLGDLRQPLARRQSIAARPIVASKLPVVQFVQIVVMVA